jgi:hypothetical protein
MTGPYKTIYQKHTQNTPTQLQDCISEVEAESGEEGVSRDQPRGCESVLGGETSKKMV